MVLFASLSLSLFFFCGEYKDRHDRTEKGRNLRRSSYWQRPGSPGREPSCGHRTEPFSYGQPQWKRGPHQKGYPCVVISLVVATKERGIDLD